jgi:uncharacterized protein (TIGR02145 family)
VSLVNQISGQAWSWVTNFTGATVYDVNTKADGTSFMAGSFPNFIINEGSAAENYYMLKIDSTGKAVQGFMKTAETFGTALQVETDEDGNIYVYGQPFVPQANNYYLKKIAPDGSILWSRRMNATIKLTTNSLRVMQGRIVVTGSFERIFNLYKVNESNVVERGLGKNCNPSCSDDDTPCPYKSEIYVANFNLDGTLLLLQKFGNTIFMVENASQPWCFVSDNEWPDYGLDAIIDTQKNVILLAFFGGQVESIGPFQFTDYVEGIAFIKIAPSGEILLAKFLSKYFSFYHEEQPERLPQINIDKKNDIYLFNGLSHLLMKFSPEAIKLWGFTWPADGDYHWIMDTEGNSFLSGNKIKKIDPNGTLVWQKDPGNVSTIVQLDVDDDKNLYHAGTNFLSKWATRLPESYTFTGSGLWSHVENWEMGTPPPAIVPKWDTVYIRTEENDSCLLDIKQTISEGAVLKVLPGSRFIVPGDLLSEPYPEDPTPILSSGIASRAAPAGSIVYLHVSVEPGKYPASSGLEVVVDLSPIGGAAIFNLQDNGIEGDIMDGDLIFSGFITLADTLLPGEKILHYFVEDAQGRKDTGQISVTVIFPVGSGLVISQIYTGGGITDNAFMHDFVALFNRSKDTLQLDGMSLQFATGSGTDLFSGNLPLPLQGTLLPGQNYLVSLAGGTAGKPLPVVPDASGDWDLQATGGKIILVNGLEGLPCNGGSSPCTTEDLAKISDLVGYGNAKFFETKAAAAIEHPATLSLQRNGKGILDSDHNLNDFLLGYAFPRNTTNTSGAPVTKVVISQLHSGGGCGYYNDYVELFNVGSIPVDITGWSLQYADSTNTSWQTIPLSGIVNPGKYYLISLKVNLGATNYLPTPDAIGSIDIHPLGGKVALVNNLKPLSTSGPSAGVVDFVGYGNANGFEGDAPAEKQGLCGALLRVYNGLQDTDNNQQDWKSRGPWPKNSSATENALIPGMNESVVTLPDGFIYTTKKYGPRWWMTENLKGSLHYDNDPANGDIFGGLHSFDYNWTGSSEVIVEFDFATHLGWVLPSGQDWKNLTMGVWHAEELKDTLHWDTAPTYGGNKSGFNLRPGGYYEVWGLGFEYPPAFHDKGKIGFFATSDARYFDYDHIQYDIALNGSTIFSYWLDEVRMYVSIRLVK